MTDARRVSGERSSIDHLNGSIFDDPDDLELQQRLEKTE